jgi:hypothetical protein
MELILVPAACVDQAWREGAYCLEEACISDCTVDQVKMLCARGDRQLVRMDDEGKIVGWGVYFIDQYPNVRALHITQLVAHNCGFERFFEQLKKIATGYGCSEIRCSAKPAQARLYGMKCGFEPVYTTLKMEIWK